DAVAESQQEEIAELNHLTSLVEEDLQNISETEHEIPVEVSQSENQNNSIGVDLDDLFIDDEQSEGGELIE
ncbi:MAG: hypothetical protein ACPHA0_04125, partial [Candidatus Poseidoniaceae archaeon]